MHHRRLLILEINIAKEKATSVSFPSPGELKDLPEQRHTCESAKKSFMILNLLAFSQTAPSIRSNSAVMTCTNIWRCT